MLIRLLPLLLGVLLADPVIMLGQSEPLLLTSSVRDLLEDKNGDLVPDRLNQLVKTKGTISSWPNTLSKKACFSCLQDDTGGIGLFTSNPEILAGRYTVGDRVEVEGTVTQYKGMELLAISRITKIGEAQPPAPRDVLAGDLWGERFSGRLVRISGTLRVPSNLAPGAKGLSLRDRSGEIPVVLTEKSFGDTPFLKRLVNGGSVEIVGIAGQIKNEAPYDSGYCLFPRNRGDFQFVASPPYETIVYALSIAILLGGLAYFWTRSRDAERHAREVEALSSQLRKSEQELRQAQKMEAIGRLAGGIAHDFNNILTVVKAYACQLLEAADAPPRFARPLSAISRSVDRAANLTQQLLLFSRQQAMQPRVLDLRAIVQNMMQMLRPVLPENIKVQVDLGPVPLPIHADETMIEQVLLNLALNARDAMPEGGPLRIQTKRMPMAEGDGRSAPEATTDRLARLIVQDKGCGIEPAQLQNIFDPFFTTKAIGKGTGLGLAIVYGIVKQHNGCIKVDSRLGEGTTFEVMLPLTERPLDPVHANPAVATESSAATILVVEDEAELRTVIKSVLETAGYRVLLAGTADEAVVTLEKSSVTPDLLLTDLIMPGSMDGFRLAECLAPRYPAMRIIYTSGYSETLNGLVELQEGRNFLPKPYPPRRLLNTVRARLASPSGRCTAS